jgi:DUF1680 family protein
MVATAQAGIPLREALLPWTRPSTPLRTAALPSSMPVYGSWTAVPFPLDQVQLTGGVWDRAWQSALYRAENAPVDRYLALFRVTAGLPNSANPPGGWDTWPTGGAAAAEAQRWGPSEYTKGQNTAGSTGLLRGHFSGHALTLIAMAYAGCADPARKAAIKANLDAFVAGLKECQAALAQQTLLGDPNTPRYSHPGFLSAYGEWQFSALEEFTRYTEIWAPYYTLHKILQGLEDAYVYGGNADALTVAEGIGHWVYSRLSKCTPTQLQTMWNIYIGGEYGGMNDVLIELYMMSSDPNKQEFLDAAKLFDNNELIDDCARGFDRLDAMHANQHIPQFIGYAKMAALETDPVKAARYRDAALGFYAMLIPGRMYAHGGTGEGELWGPPNTVIGDIGTRNAESCAAYNQLKLARALFSLDQDPGFMDYYERTQLNHILAGRSAAQNNTTNGVLNPYNVYMFPVHPGATRSYSNTGTCCGGTAMESHAKYQDTVFMHSPDDSVLWVNLYIPTVLEWASAGFRLIQTTAYPEADTSALRFDVAGTAPLEVRLRIPGWAEGATVQVNSDPAQPAPAGAYAVLPSRVWTPGDTITVTIPLNLRLEGTVDSESHKALFHGPSLLFGRTSGTNYPEMSVYRDYGLAGQVDPASLLEPAGSARPNEFTYGTIRYEPAYLGTTGAYMMYLVHREKTVGFGGKDLGIPNPTGPGGTTLMDEIWAGAPFATKAEFVRQVKEVTAAYAARGQISNRVRQEILLAAYQARLS